MDKELLNHAVRFRIYPNQDFEEEKEDLGYEVDWKRNLDVVGINCTQIASDTVTFLIEFERVEDISVGGLDMLDLL